MSDGRPSKCGPSLCADCVAKRQLLAVPKPPADADVTDPDEPPTLSHPCPCCGGRMIIIETLAPGCQPRYQPSTTTVPIRIDTS